MKCCRKCFCFFWVPFSWSHGKICKQSYMLKSLESSLSSFCNVHVSINQFQPLNNWPVETGIACFLLGLFSVKTLGFATAVSLAVFPTEADTSFTHPADGHTLAVAGPKPLCLGSSWEMWSQLGRCRGACVVILCWSAGRVSSFGMCWVFQLNIRSQNRVPN